MPLGEAATPHLRYRCLRRGDLNSALQAEVTRRGIDIRHGARLMSVVEGQGGVTAHFADGTTATGDLLIGADGLNSTVRRLISPDARPVYAGQYVCYGYTGAASGPARPETITMVRGSSVAFGYAVSPDGETYWFARVTDEPLAADTIAQGTPPNGATCSCRCCARTRPPPPTWWQPPPTASWSPTPPNCPPVHPGARAGP